MGALPYILIGIVALIGAPIFFFVLAARKRAAKGEGGGSARNREAVVRDAQRKLLQNPRDVKALQALADVAYRDEDFAAARTHYKTLVDLCAGVPGIDEYQVTLRHGVSALKMGDPDDAYKSLMFARNLKQDDFEVNFNLGAVEFARGEHEKAAAFFNRAHSADPENTLTIKNLAACLYKIKKYKEAIPFLRKVLELTPEDKEALFSLGNAYLEAGQSDMAVKIFTHLRTDPKMGPSAALFSGTIYLNSKLYDKAIMDLELGLRHEGVRPEVALELRYRLAIAHLRKEDIPRAMTLWKEITSINPRYRDVPELLARYGELSSNRKLQTYMLAPTSDFVTLCRKMATSFYSKSKTKLLNISFRQSEYVDIVAEVDTTTWSDIILFRFVRTTGVIGELLLRDLYAKLKEIKGGRGVCVAPGTYSEGAKGFVEARIVDLIDKNGLTNLLARIPEGI
jgi:tetratricopeptide (TPR) repeat protein